MGSVNLMLNVKKDFYSRINDLLDLIQPIPIAINRYDPILGNDDADTAYILAQGTGVEMPGPDSHFAFSNILRFWIQKCHEGVEISFVVYKHCPIFLRKIDEFII